MTRIALLHDGVGTMDSAPFLIFQRFDFPVEYVVTRVSLFLLVVGC